MAMIQIDPKVLEWLDEMDKRLPGHAIPVIQIMSDGSGAVETSDGDTIFYEEADGTVREMMFTDSEEIDAFVNDPATLETAWVDD